MQPKLLGNMLRSLVDQGQAFLSEASPRNARPVNSRSSSVPAGANVCFLNQDTRSSEPSRPRYALTAGIANRRQRSTGWMRPNRRLAKAEAPATAFTLSRGADLEA